MPAAPSKSATPAAGTRAERATARDDRTEGRIAGIDTSMADPVEQLQRIAGNTAVSALAALRNPGSTGGEPLPDQLRGELETRFGEDFEGVRIHADGRAADAAAALHAKAYTLGENIVFGVRRFAPETFEGRRLLAHELAHVVQQRRGGGLPELRRGSALELAADQAARSVATGTGPVAVNGAAGIGISRETDEDEIDKALSTWTKLDQQTEEEARRKPGPPPKRDTTTATTNPPPKADAVDPTLRDSRALREQRKELLRQREEARKRGEDPAAIKPKPPVVDIDKYRDAVRAATQKQSEDEIKRHADAVSKQPAMTHEDMFNKTLAMRGFDAGASVWDRERLQNDYDALKKQLQTHPDAPAIDALHDQNKKLKAEIAKLDRSARKQGKLSTEDQERLDKLKQTLASNTATIEASPVTALRQKASSLHDKLAISGLRDPDAPKGSSGKAAASKGAPAGRGENTYAILQVIGPDGKIVAWGAGKNTAEGHAEENALVQIRRQIKGMPKGLPPGSRVEVVGDQVVCSEICKPALAKFAEEHHVESVDGYTFHAVKPGGGGQPKAGSVLSPKTTAKDATTEAASGWALQRKHEPIYRAGTGIIGGGAPTAGEVHRHAQKEKQRRAQKAARKIQPTPAAGAKGPPTDAKATRRQTKRAATSAAAPRGPKTRSGNPAAALPGSRARGSKPEPTGKAPPAKADAAKTPRRTRATPTGSATKTTAPATRATAGPRRRGQTKTPTVPPPAPPHTKPRPPRSAPRADAGKLASGATVTASPAAQAAKSRQSRASAQNSQPQTFAQAPSVAKRASPRAAATPGSRPPASSPPQVRRSTEITRGGGAFLAPGTAGASAQAGVQATQERGKGITTSQTLNVEGSVSLDITEIPDTSPQRYRVTLHVDLGAQAGAGAGRENASETARAGASLSAAGSLSALFSHELSADEARKYRLAAEGGGGGNYQELEIVRLLAARRRDAAAALLQQVKAAAGSAEAAKKLAKGDVAQVSAEGTVGGGVNAGAGKSGGSALGIELGVFRSGKIERRVEERDGKIVVTLTIASEQGRTLGGTASEGVGSFGYANTAAESRLRSVSFSLDPNDAQFDARFNAITRTSSIDELDRLRGSQPGLVGATTTGKGKSETDTVNAGVLGVGLELSQSGSFNEQERRDERGVSRHYEGSSGGGAKLKVGDKAVASTATTDTFVADVGPDNTATGETSTRRSESDIGKSVDNLGHSLAKNPVTTVTGVLTGKTKLLQEKVQQSGAALTNDSYAQLAALAEDPQAWTRAFNANVNGSFTDWQKTRNKVLAANGDRNQIARAIAEFEAGGGIGRGSTVERALGKSGIAFEFPDELSDQKQVYDSLIVGDPVGHARELAERGQQEAAINELNAANDKLSKLAAAANAHTGAFESPAKLAEMLNRVADRRAELRAEVHQLSRAAAPQAASPAPKPEIGPPTPEQQTDAEAEQRAKKAELLNQQLELIQTCTTLRVREQSTFSHVREEMDSWHLDHLGASIDMAKALTAVKGSYAAWDETIQKLKASYQELGQDPAAADALVPDRKQWDAVNAQWKVW